MKRCVKRNLGADVAKHKQEFEEWCADDTRATPPWGLPWQPEPEPPLAPFHYLVRAGLPIPRKDWDKLWKKEGASCSSTKQPGFCKIEFRGEFVYGDWVQPMNTRAKLNVPKELQPDGEWLEVHPRRGSASVTSSKRKPEARQTAHDKRLKL